MSEYIGETTLSANEVKEGLEIEEFARAMHKEALIKRYGRSAAEKRLAAEEEQRRMRG